MKIPVLALLSLFPAGLVAERQTLSLNGAWDVADSLDAGAIGRPSASFRPASPSPRAILEKR